jgi:hypothetical protein
MKQPIKVKWVLVPLDMRQIKNKLYSIMNNHTLYFVLRFIQGWGSKNKCLTKKDHKRQI